MKHSGPANFESEWFLFILFLSIIGGFAFGFADVYDHMSNVDVQTYVGLSEFDCDQHPVRRYRVIIPLLAAAIHFVFGSLFEMLSPNEFPGDFGRIMSFVVVNSSLMAVYAILLFKICKTVLGESYFWPAIIGVISVLTCRWTMLLSGSALVDSLYLVALALLLLGVLRQQLWMLILAVYLGPWTKEAFIFFIPLLLFVHKRYYTKLILHILISGALVMAFRYLFDLYIGADFGESFTRDVSHLEMIPLSLKRLFSFHGLYEVLSIGGVWNIFIVLALFNQKARLYLIEKLGLVWGVLCLMVLVQALLSHELARMFYLLTPLLAVVISLLFKLLARENKLESFHGKEV